MTQEQMHQTIVVAANGKLVGMLSSSDVMKDVLGTVRAALPVSIIDVASSSAATDNDLAP
jgi:CBS domain containing-hemolysin-like protein